MTERTLSQNRAIVEALGSALHHGHERLDAVPGLVLKTIQTKAWQEFETARDGHVIHVRFEEFVTDNPTKGLGASMGLLRQVCSDNQAALDAIDEVVATPHGGDRRSEDFNVYNVHVEPRPSGNSTAAALRRLRIENPDLHKQVIDKKLSPNAAAVKAGLRPRTGTYRPDDPEYTARALLRNMSPDNLAKLKELL